jgi:hypothetical protein
MFITCFTSQFLEDANATASIKEIISIQCVYYNMIVTLLKKISFRRKYVANSL